MEIIIIIEVHTYFVLGKEQLLGWPRMVSRKLSDVLNEELEAFQFRHK